jgi:hypothetical protein
MLFILIPIGWLTIAAFAVILCRGAAAADAVLIADAENVGLHTAPRATMRSQLPAQHVWRRPGPHPASRASTARLRGTRVGR